jgi:hypothetical protein
MKLTRYEKEFARIVGDLCEGMTPTAIVEELCRVGVLDHTMCKVLAVRRWVEQTAKQCDSKTEAMWMATDRFCVTFEYVRRCMYYYTDVNI